MNTKYVEVDGQTYHVYNKSTQLILDAVGLDALALGDIDEESPSDSDIIRGYDHIKKVLKVAMIDPRLGDEMGEGVVTWYELGDSARKLFDKIMDSDDAPSNFTESSEGQAEPK
jgi:hypothetical protein